MSRISKFDVLLLMQQLDELLEDRKNDKNKDEKQKNARNL
jgi:hypothetical protein